MARWRSWTCGSWKRAIARKDIQPSSGAAVEGVAVRLRAGDDQFATVGAADSGGFGVSLFGGRGAARFLGAERVSQAARASHERYLHAGAGAGALAGAG